MRTAVSFQLDNPQKFKKNLLHWAQQFETVIWLDSNMDENHNTLKYSSYDTILAVESAEEICINESSAFQQFHKFQTQCHDWIFGYFSYDLKNDVEALSSKNADYLGFPELYFFRPKKLFLFRGQQLTVAYLSSLSTAVAPDVETISNIDLSPQIVKSKVLINSRITKAKYLKQVKKMLHHIQLGNIYEANFCQEFYAENAVINPCLVYEKLNEISKPPFATFFKNKGHYLMSASPERYLKKSRNKIISQPIKGTARRSKKAEEDNLLAQALQASEKERSENIMITDLVRNDLSRTASKNCVKVEELCELYSYRQVHQLVSTITSEVNGQTSVSEMIKTTFPMGSMTGAPKVSAMKIIEELESMKRGLFSGAVGYITPENDFDFNVIIRSILYNQSSKYLSFSVGSAITSKSVPEQEYEECLVKAAAMRQVLEEE